MTQIAQKTHAGRRDVLLAAGGAAVVGAAGLGLRQRAVRAADAGAPDTLTPPEALAAAREGRAVLIDIRRPDEWAATGCPAAARHVDMRRGDFAAAVRAAAGSPDRPVALIRARGVRSRRMADALRTAGLARVLDVPEGMLGSPAGPGWLARRLPVQQFSEDRA